jgi:hypothetical protein
MRDRVIAMLALAIPVLAGLAYLASNGAPTRYLATNAIALAIAGLCIALTPRGPARLWRRALIALLLASLFLPLATGPHVGTIARWLPLGPFALHAGMLSVPLLAVLLGEDDALAPGLLLLALLACLLQPDMATGAALMLAAVGLYDATRDWRYGPVAIAGFAASLVAAMRGELPAQPFADRIIFLLARTDPLAALGLVLALVASFYLIVSALPGRETSRKALAGSLFGFSFAGIVSNYPSALVGYGAAPILGYGLALAVLATRARPMPPEKK